MENWRRRSEQRKGETDCGSLITFGGRRKREKGIGGQEFRFAVKVSLSLVDNDKVLGVFETEAWQQTESNNTRNIT